MKDLYVYGAGLYGVKLVEKIKKEGFQNRIISIIDKYTDKRSLLDVDIIRLEMAKDKTAAVLIALSDVTEAQKVAITLLEEEFTNVFFIESNLFSADLKIFDANGNFTSALVSMDKCKPILSYLEFQVADNCNLNCRMCGHFSNAVKEEKYASVKEVKNDLDGLSQYFSNIKIIRLMGGEPFLSAELPKFVKIARKSFPYSDIRIVTNGILIPKISDEDWEIYRNNSVTIDLTQYPVLEKNIFEYIDIMRSHNVKYSIGEKVSSFFVNLSRNASEDYMTAFNEYCLSKTCHFLRNGRLFACPRIPMAYEMQDFLGICISEEEFLDSSISLYDNVDGWDILKKLYNPVPACKICTKTKYVEWKCGGEPCADDYFAD